jgi:hypothetical protein
MIKAIASDGTGKNILVIGLSFANLDKFRKEPGDTFIRIRGAEVGLPVDVMIFSGQTEAHCAKTLEAGIGPDTKVNVSPRLKQ